MGNGWLGEVHALRSLAGRALTRAFCLSFCVFHLSSGHRPASRRSSARPTSGRAPEGTNTRALGAERGATLVKGSMQVAPVLPQSASSRPSIWPPKSNSRRMRGLDAPHRDAHPSSERWNANKIANFSRPVPARVKPCSVTPTSAGVFGLGSRDADPTVGGRGSELRFVGRYHRSDRHRRRRCGRRRRVRFPRSSSRPVGKR